MKKLLITTFIFIVSFFAFSITTYALMIDDPGSNIGGLWHVQDGNRVYVHMRYNDGHRVNETGEEQDHPNHTVWEAFSEDDFYFDGSHTPKRATISNPNIAVYGRFVVEIIAHVGRTTATPEVIQIADMENVSQITIELNDWGDRPNPHFPDFSWIELFVDGVPILNSRNVHENFHDDHNPNFIHIRFAVRIFFERETIEDPIDPTDPEDPTDPGSIWEQLPTTSGSPANPLGDWGTVEIVNYNADMNSISFNIKYLGVVYPVSNFVVDGNLDFISQANDILYFTDAITGDRILYFNFGETIKSAILKSNSIENMNVWRGEALWNLTQNEIKVIEVRTVYNYIPEITADGVVYSYFFMPGIPIDSLISVSANLVYRYWNDGFLGIGQPTPGPVISKTVTATAGQTSIVNPTWVETTYQTAYITGAVTAAMAVLKTPIGHIPKLGWAITGAAFVIGGVFHIADEHKFFAYNIDQIVRVTNPGEELINNINLYIRSKSGTDAFNPNTDDLFKLHLATLTSGDSVQIMGDLSNVTQIVWQTSGQIFILEEENILDPGWGGEGTEIPAIENDIADRLISGLGKLIMENQILFAVVGGIIFLMILPKIHRSYKNVRKGASILFTPFGLITAAIVIIGILYLLGKL